MKKLREKKLCEFEAKVEPQMKFLIFIFYPDIATHNAFIALLHLSKRCNRVIKVVLHIVL